MKDQQTLVIKAISGSELYDYFAGDKKTRLWEAAS